MDERKRILIIDDEETVCSACQMALMRAGYRVDTLFEGSTVAERLTREQYDLVLTDLRLPGMDGMEIIKKTRELSPHTSVIVMTGFASIDSAVETIKLGSSDYLAKPFGTKDLIGKVQKCFESRKEAVEKNESREIESFYEISQVINTSLELKELLDLILRYACNILKADAGSILLFDEFQQKLNIEVVYHLEIAAGEQVREYIIREFAGGAFLSDKLPWKIAQGMGGREGSPGSNSVIFALKVHDKIIGFLHLSIASQARDFTRKDLELLSIFATNVTLAIRNAQILGRVKEFERLKSEFVANVSHELRTPLTSLQGALQLLSQGVGGELNDKGKQLLEVNERNTCRMIGLIRDLLDFSKMEAGLILQPKKMDLGVVLAEVVEEMKGFADEAGVSFRYDVREEMPACQGDSERIRQALRNVLHNAVKFSGKNGTVVIECKMLIKKNALISVSDSGVGIPRESLDKVFEKFYQVDGSMSRSWPGVGLGLSTAKLIVEAHRGRIWVKSEAGKGTNVFIQLPLCDGDDIQN